MQRRLFLVLCLSFPAIACWLVSQPVAISQDEPDCFMTSQSGHVVDLNHLCERSEPNRIETVKEIKRRGRDLARSERYQEAITDFTEAIRLAPDYEVYILRAAALTLVKDFEGAARDYEQAAELSRSKGELERAQVTQKLAEEVRGSN